MFVASGDVERRRESRVHTAYTPLIDALTAQRISGLVYAVTVCDGSVFMVLECGIYILLASARVVSGLPECVDLCSEERIGNAGGLNRLL